MSPLADALMRKSRRALRSARLDLRDGDTDGAVNRSYYAMFNAAQVALLSSGVPEDKLPKTHAGLISAFGERVVKRGKVDPEFGRAIRKTESLRLRADYTGAEFDLAAAEKALAGAERFVQSVEQAFGLQSISAETASDTNQSAKQNASGQEGKEPLWDKSEGMEERRQQAVQNWLEYRKKQREAAQTAARERENARTQNQSNAPDRERDIEDNDG